MRNLKAGDRVMITGPWCVGEPEGSQHIGKFATVLGVYPTSAMPVRLRIDGLIASLRWCRENLRALPRTNAGGSP